MNGGPIISCQVITWVGGERCQDMRDGLRREILDGLLFGRISVMRAGTDARVSVLRLDAADDAFLVVGESERADDVPGR